MSDDKRLTVPVPAKFNENNERFGWTDLPPVDVAEVRARQNRDRVMWYEIEALCDALLDAAADRAQLRGEA